MEKIGEYVVVKRLGEGGMGSVSLGRSPNGRLVVLKVPLIASDTTTARLQDEARIGFRLRHPHVVQTLDFFFHDDKPVLVIDYVDGASLKDLRDERGAIHAAAVAHIGAQICNALAAIHEATDEHGRPLQMLHRDVTPGNILIDRFGNARLIDLGIARSTENMAGKTSTGILKGTFRYLAPELFTGAPYSVATDLWALAVTLWEAALGRRAVSGTEHEVFRAIQGGTLTQLKPDEVMDPMLGRVLRALLEEPARRMSATAREAEHTFQRALRRIGVDGAAEARRLMGGVAQGDVSGEFGSDESVPTIFEMPAVDPSLLMPPRSVAAAAALSSSDAPPTSTMPPTVPERPGARAAPLPPLEGPPTVQLRAQTPVAHPDASAMPAATLMLAVDASAFEQEPTVTAPVARRAATSDDASALPTLQIPMVPSSSAAPPTLLVHTIVNPPAAVDAPPTVPLRAPRLASRSAPSIATPRQMPAWSDAKDDKSRG